MDKKLFGIGVLSLMAAVLFVANFIPLNTATAADTIKDRDFTVVTSPTVQGGEALYVVDNRTGMIAVFTWDTSARNIRLRAVRPVADAFQ